MHANTYALGYMATMCRYHTQWRIKMINIKSSGLGATHGHILATLHRIHDVQPPVFGQYAALGAIALCSAGSPRSTVCTNAAMRSVLITYKRRRLAATAQ